MTGDNDQLAYLLRHKNGILFGKKLYDRPQPYITALEVEEKKWKQQFKQWEDCSGALNRLFKLKFSEIC